MINATYATFNQTPKALNSICMGVSVDIHSITMNNSLMLLSHFINDIIDRIFVRIDDGFLSHVFSDQRHDGRAFGI